MWIGESVVTQSTTKAEYEFMALATYELV